MFPIRSVRWCSAVDACSGEFQFPGPKAYDRASTAYLDSLYFGDF